MIEKFVWPRLPDGSARAVMSDLSNLSLTDLRSRSSVFHPDAAPVEVGGTPVEPSRIVEVRDAIRSVAEHFGFPVSLGRARVSDFDRPVTRLLHSTMSIVPADAASPGVWSFLSLVVLPDVTVWRWPDRTPERLLGRPRNAYRRLWWRAEVVGADLIDRPDGLGEDELVNIMERPSMAADARLSSALAAELLRQAAHFSAARSEVMRDAAKRILRFQAVACPEALTDDHLWAVVSQAVSDAAEALRRKGDQDVG